MRKIIGGDCGVEDERVLSFRARHAPWRTGGGGGAGDRELSSSQEGLRRAAAIATPGACAAQK